MCHRTSWERHKGYHMGKPNHSTLFALASENLVPAHSLSSGKNVPLFLEVKLLAHRSNFLTGDSSTYFLRSRDLLHIPPSPTYFFSLALCWNMWSLMWNRKSASAWCSLAICFVIGRLITLPVTVVAWCFPWYDPSLSNFQLCQTP